MKSGTRRLPLITVVRNDSHYHGGIIIHRQKSLGTSLRNADFEEWVFIRVGCQPMFLLKFIALPMDVDELNQRESSNTVASIEGYVHGIEELSQ